MGIRFDIATANWLAYVIERDAPLPRMKDSSMEQETLRWFLQKLRDRFYSTKQRERVLENLVIKAQNMLDNLANNWESKNSSTILNELRSDLGGRPWTALIVPTGRNRELDRFLTSEDFLMRLIGIRSDEPGLILQLEEIPDEVFTLTDVFPAFRTALAESTRWPGVLIWTPSGDSVFLPFPSRSHLEIEKSASWVISQLSDGLGADLELLQKDFLEEFPSIASSSSRVHLLHLSDIHLGSKEASRRHPRVQQLIRNLLDELGDTGTVVPVVSGDLMDTPNDNNLDRVGSFIDFLCSLGTEQPIIVLGNHDVREGGILSERLKPAFQLPVSRIVWLDTLSLGIVCFNSVTGGDLACGEIGETQFFDIANDIDRKVGWQEYSLVGVLHHHPMPVSRPDWYRAPFYERILGGAFKKTDKLIDAEQFLHFVERRSFAAIMHGHKHIPRADYFGKQKIPIFGCGSTVGKVGTKGVGTYMSINVVTIDRQTGQLAGRILGERIPGEGLVEEKRHEILLRGLLHESVSD